MRALVIFMLCVSLAAPLAAKKKKKAEKEPPGRLPRADMPKPGEDFSAHRLDADVWGWSKDFKKMAVVGLEVKRNEDSAHRGWVFVMVFPVGSLEPEFKIISTRHTQAALPHNPEPIPDVRDYMWSVEYDFQRAYPKRCKVKQPRGAMEIEPIWEFVEDSGACTPAVGFLMKWKGQTRYQPHQLMKLAADCELMRYTDHRTYWGKKDVGAVMIRFDWGPPKNESSARIPLPASWDRGRELKLAVNGNNPKPVRDLLAQYGKVDVTAGGEGRDWEVRYGADDLVYLAHRIAAQIEGTVAKARAPEGVDILVVRATAAPVETPAPAWQNPDRADDDEPDYDDCGGLLRDCGK